MGKDDVAMIYTWGTLKIWFRGRNAAIFLHTYKPFYHHRQYNWYLPEPRHQTPTIPHNIKISTMTPWLAVRKCGTEGNYRHAGGSQDYTTASLHIRESGILG